MEDDTFIELHEYRKALESELTVEVSPQDPPDQIRNKARSFAIHHLPTALDTLSDLLHADKDPVKLSAAKAIINIAFQTSPQDETDPIEALFSKLMTPNTSNHPDLPEEDDDT